MSMRTVIKCKFAAPLVLIDSQMSYNGTARKVNSTGRALNMQSWGIMMVGS